ncbi:MAG: ribosome maturation factor RimM [Muribaculaceae bacterium]|nr:ribosome maturation factor RimM [Muribaculaceae bacterium]
MIDPASLALVGKVNKTHGVKGELSISFSADDPSELLADGGCLIMDIDGLFTPFFVASSRPRGSESLLVRFDGVDSQEEAAQFVGKDVYVDAALAYGEEDMPDDGQLYAGQLIGFKAIDENGDEIGEIVDLDESTDNVLFVLQTPAGLAYVPVADEFIMEISTKARTVEFDLPEGLLQLNS